VAVEPDRRIVFTWGYEGDGQAVPAGSSTVEITLEPVADGTEVRLRHSGLPAGQPPLAHLAARGAPEACHGLVRFGWAAVGPGEAVLATGTNVAGTDLDDRFRWLTGFWDPPPERPEPAEQV
jgi:uncharacterized protein YndB with AHSA1/START domain